MNVVQAAHAGGRGAAMTRLNVEAAGASMTPAPPEPSELRINHVSGIIHLIDDRALGKV